MAQGTPRKPLPAAVIPCALIAAAAIILPTTVGLAVYLRQRDADAPVVVEPAKKDTSTPADTGRPRKKKKKRAAAPVPEAPGLVVRVVDPGPTKYVQLECPGADAKRSSLSNATARFTDVPEGNCTISLIGGTTARYTGPVAGRELVCEPSLSTLTCR